MYLLFMSYPAGHCIGIPLLSVFVMYG